MTPYQKNKALRELQLKKSSVQIDDGLRILKIMVDAAITRGEKSICVEISEFVSKHCAQSLHVDRLPKKR
jgi:hypothetical protein